MLTATIRGKQVVVSAGGIRLSGAQGTARIPLLDEAVRIPAGARIVVSVGATSLGQPSGNPLYAADVPAGASITIGRETLRLSVLKRAVSR